ncbi:MAG: deoxyribonuclease IV [Phycisphaerales bacterium]|nr:deoxyribonuclease IV [Phycisphaerales bacterium]
MFGSHLSIAGSMCNALDEAESLGLDTVQVFTKNQQQWKAKPLDATTIDSWRSRVAELGFSGRTVSHASYLINLASPDDALWAKSIDLMTDEIERCEQLGIPFLVHHPGAFTTSTREAGLARIARAYRELFTRTKGYRVVSCLENTVGSGSNLGREFTELAALRDLILNDAVEAQRLGVCIDTCHAHAGGYDLSTFAAASQAIDRLEAELGLQWVRVLHLNDSKGALGSRLDRHEHIGRGTIGDAGFQAVLRRSEFANIPKILETPKEGEDGSELWDTVNLRRLKALQQGSSVEPISISTAKPEPAKSKGKGSFQRSPSPRGKSRTAPSAKPIPRSRPERASQKNPKSGRRGKAERA